MNHRPAAANLMLKQLQCLGSASLMKDSLFNALGHARFFDDFTRENISTLSQFMEIYKAEPGQVIIREGDVDDYMLFIIEGRMADSTLKCITHCLDKEISCL